MKKENNETKEKSVNKVLSFIFRIFLSIAFIVLLIVIYNAFFNKNEYADLSDPNIVETENGYKKVIEFNTVVDSKKLEKDGSKKKYIVVCYDEKEKYEIEVRNYLYSHLSEDEEISVKGNIYYNEKGLKISSDLEVKSLVDEDDYGIVDIPDGYKEPEPERIEGVDYGDGY